MITIKIRNQWLGWPWRRRESAVIRDVAAGRPISGGRRATRAACGRRHELRGIARAVPRRQLRAEERLSRVRSPTRCSRARAARSRGLGILPGADAQVAEYRPAVRPGRDLRAARIRGQRLPGQARCVPSARRRSCSARHRPGGTSGRARSRTSTRSRGIASTLPTRYLTANVNVWPRWVVVFMNAQVFEELQARSGTRCGRRWEGDPEHALGRQSREEADAVLCDRGLTSSPSPQADITELRAALSPILARSSDRSRRSRMITEAAGGSSTPRLDPAVSCSGSS